MATLNGILETAVYVDDLGRAQALLRGGDGAQADVPDRRLTAYDVAGRGVLLVFKRGASTQPAAMPGGGSIPAHDGAGPLHVAFASRRTSWAAWEERLKAHGVGDRRAHRLAARREEHLFPRSGWPPHRTRHPRPLAGLLKILLLAQRGRAIIVRPIRFRRNQKRIGRAKVRADLHR